MAKALTSGTLRFWVQPLKAEAELYVRHSKVSRNGNFRDNVTTVSKAQMRLASMQAREKTASREDAAESAHLSRPCFPDLEILLSAHVDDLKGGARPEVAEALL